VPDDTLDWHRFGPELATTLLRRQLPGPPPEAPTTAQLSDDLTRSIRNPQLRDWLGLGNA
jgi:hypothetical protein